MLRGKIDQFRTDSFFLQASWQHFNNMECYICAESDARVRSDLCACVGRGLHLDCQRRLLATVEHDGACTVCRTRYRNLRVSHHLSCTSVGVHVGIFVCYLLLTLGLTLSFRAATVLQTMPVGSVCMCEGCEEPLCVTTRRLKQVTMLFVVLTNTTSSICTVQALLTLRRLLALRPLWIEVLRVDDDDCTRWPASACPREACA